MYLSPIPRQAFCQLSKGLPETFSCVWGSLGFIFLEKPVPPVLPHRPDQDLPPHVPSSAVARPLSWLLQRRFLCCSSVSEHLFPGSGGLFFLGLLLLRDHIL